MKTFNTKGVCSKQISFDIQDNAVKDVSFIGGCDGNLQAIANLIEGMSVDEAVTRLKGIRCGMKSTSCGDQLALALEQAK